MNATRIVLAVALGALAARGAPAQAGADPLAFFSPTVATTVRERERVVKGEPLVKVLTPGDREVAVFAVVPTTADFDRFVTWVRHVDQLKKSPLVLSIGRFSSPPRLEDVSALSLVDDDLEAIRQCRPGSCDVKLTAAEIASLQQAAGAGADWKTRLRDAFRRQMLARVQAYLAGGQASLGSYADGNAVRPLQATFSAILSRSPYLAQKQPRFAEYLDRYPQAPLPGVETVLYWSVEQFGGKPVTMASHVSIWRDSSVAPGWAIVAGRQIFATHYMNGSLNVMTILPGAGGMTKFLVTLNRSEVDVLGGMWGGLARVVVERRVRSEAAEVLQGLRKRLETELPRGGDTSRGLLAFLQPRD